MTAISLKQIKKLYGTVPVIHGVDIEIASGEFLVLVGPSGCGKSTLLRMIAGLEEISSGELKIGDTTVNTLPPSDRDIAMVFQDYALYPHMSVEENMAFGLKMRSEPATEIDKRVAGAADILKLQDYLERRPAQLSGGQRQRVAMGRAIVREPAAFLFDEPLSNLDAALRVEMRLEIAKLHKRMRATTVYVTHDQVEAMTLGDRIAVMKDGLVQQLGTPEEIYERPANLYVAGFIGAPTMNLLPLKLGVRDGRWQATLRSAVGSTELMLGPVADAGWRDREVILGLRPEHFHETEADAPGSLPVRVDLLEPTGADTFAFAEINGRRAGLRLAPRRGRSVGDTLWLRPDPAAVCLFDPATEQRIAP